MKKLIVVGLSICLGGVATQAVCYAGGTLALQASMFNASGPVTVSQDQTATVCASNMGSQTVKVLIALLNANTTPNGPNNAFVQQYILAAREAALDPGKGFCLSKTGSELKNAVGPNANQQIIIIPWDTHVIAAVIPGGFFTGTTDSGGGILQAGIIVQQGGEGILSNLIGIVQSSLQITGPGTLIYPNMALRSVNPGPPTNH